MVVRSGGSRARVQALAMLVAGLAACPLALGDPWTVGTSEVGSPDSSIDTGTEDHEGVREDVGTEASQPSGEDMDRDAIEDVTRDLNQNAGEGGEDVLADEVANEASVVVDSGVDAPYVDLDALPICNPMTCARCCSNGSCIGDGGNCD